MGQVALGLLGAGVGFMVGGPAGAQIGWMLGAFAWNLLDPPKIYGPRLNDTKVRGADYGAMRPILYGAMRVGGIGMGQGSVSAGPNQFTETEESSGGKGGPEMINYRYNLSFFNEICEGPIIGVQRRWANGRLVTDQAEPASDTWPYVLYLGDTTQLPDPTMELIYGTGEVAAMRGVAHESVTELAMQDYGNARANVEYEAYTVAGAFPWRVSTFDPDPGAGADCVTYSGGRVTVGSYTTTAGGHYYEKVFDLQGNDLGPDYNNALTGTPTTLHPIVNLLGACSSEGAFYQRDVLVTTVVGDPLGGTGDEVTSGQSIVYQNDYIYAMGANTLNSHIGISRWPATDGVIDVNTGTAADTHDFGATGIAFSLYIIGVTNRDVVYVLEAGATVTLYEFQSDLSAIIRQWDLTTEYGANPIFNGVTFTVYEDILCVNRGIITAKSAYAFRLNDDLTATAIAGVNFAVNSGIVEMGNSGYCLIDDGIISLVPPPGPAILGDIVSDLLQRAGLTVGQIDVTDLTQEVNGFLVAAQMTVRNAIDTLRKAYFFDVTEVDGKIVCRNRGHDATDTIPDGDLAAHEPGADPPEPLDVTRVPESELPRTVFINYYDREHDYQTGSQYWRRTVTQSQSDVTLDLPLAFSATEALLRAQWHMHFAWLERDRYTFYTTRKWTKLTPTDVVVVRGVNIRITTKTESPNGLIKFEGVRAFAGPYTSPITDPGGSGAPGGEVPGSGGGGQPPQEPPTVRASTAAVFIDGPWLSESDSDTGFSAAVYKVGTGAWPGAALYKSIDGGTTYTAVASTSSGATIGTVALALGNFTGGNIVDEANSITVVLVSGTLESTTADGLLAGLHLVALGSEATGWEFLQYRTATLTGTLTYKLTGLLRGRFGTEWMMSTHTTGETLVLMASTIDIAGSFAEIGLSRKYKPVTFGTALADATAEDFTNTGVALKPLSPVLLGGGRDASANLTLSWTPRRRGSGGWPDGVDLPDSEPSVGYRVRIYTTSGYATVARTITATSATASYTAAEQTTDFGSTQSTVYWDVAKLGTAGYGYAARGTT